MPPRPSSPAAKSRHAIGVFDSGIGGLTVVQQLMRLMPQEDIIYLGDTARTPYGTKSPETICRYATENAAFLLDKGIKLLVVACNSVSAVALDLLRQQLPVPVVGVIEPGAREAARRTRNGKVGVIGTEATISSGAYTRALKQFAPTLEIYTRACPLFVPLAEEGWVNNEVARAAARRYLASLRRSGIDTLVLGCTHYPLLAPVIGEILGPQVALVDSAGTTAQTVRRELQRHKLLRSNGSGSLSFFVTDAPERFIKVGSFFLGQPVESAVRLER
ncbi:MAG: glutamate racemase [Candidatus Binatia bacterium]|nr:glutamate racemase [Candidatus Binatia bacterium]